MGCRACRQGPKLFHPELSLEVQGKTGAKSGQQTAGEELQMSDRWGEETGDR